MQSFRIKIVALCRRLKDERPYLFLGLHEFRRFRGIDRIQEFGHDKGQLFELDGLRDVRVEARFHAFRVDVTEDVGRKCNDGYAAVTMFLLPASNFFARLIAVLVRHMQIALYSD
jgi:hypothetical protein